MWRLTIKQEKTFASGDKGYTVEQEVSYEDEDVYSLLVMVGQLTRRGATGKTKYEIIEIQEEK